MPLIHLTTKINAPLPLVFDLARNIDFHQHSVSETQEKAIAGRTSGLIELGETVTWQAVHFGIKQQLTTQITAMNAPHAFRDEMVYGAFKSMRHEHFFYLESARYDKNDSILTSNTARYNKNESIYAPVKSTSDLSGKQTEKTLVPEKQEGCTIMVDLFHFESPLGILGKLTNVLFLTRHTSRFLHIRNAAIKKEAEANSA